MLLNTMSYFHQAANIPLTSSTIPALFDTHTDRNPTKEAVVIYNSEGERKGLSFKDLQDHSLNLAASLLENGFGRGDRTVVMLPNCPEFLVVSLALSRLGTNVFLFTCGWSAELTAKHFQKYECTKIFIHSSLGVNFWERLQVLLDEKIPVKSAVCVGEESLPGTWSYQEIMKLDKNRDLSAVKEIQSQIQPDDPAFVLLSSGSTGEPKGAQHTHFTLINSKILSTSVLNSNEDSVMFNNRPMGWIACFQPGIMFVFCLGATLVTTCGITVQQSHIKEICSILEKEKCTHSMVLVYMLYDLLHFDQLDKFDLSALKYAMTGGQPVSQETVRALIHKLPHITIFHLYGSSEAQVYVAHESIDAYKTQSSSQHLGVLTPFPHVEIKIVDSNDRIVKLNELGELCLRGPGVFLEYLELEVAKQQLSPTHWFRTKDVAMMVGEGKIRVLGRTGDVIKRACDAIFPAAVESILIKHHAVKQVIVVGVPDERFYMEVCACVIVIPGYELNTEEMAAWCDLNFDNFEGGFSEKPKYFLALEAFPLTVSGKTDRQQLKEIATELLGLS